MADMPDFQRKQYEFAAHIRDPDRVPAPKGIEDRRMGVYRHLFFNNLRNLLGGMFPVLRKILADSKWDALVRQFMQQHRSVTPYFLQLPQEFVDFLHSEYELQEDDFPFLTELAHYEYIEIALSISEAVDDLDGVDPGEDREAVFEHAAPLLRSGLGALAAGQVRRTQMRRSRPFQ